MELASLIVKIGADMSEFEKSIAKTQRDIRRIGSQFTKTGKALSTYVTAPIMAVGAAAVAAGLKMDDALDAIRVGTGATGKTLEGLQNSFRSVAKTAPNDIMQVSQVIADLNTRLGLTGAPLEKLSKQVLDASRLMGVDSAELVRQFTRTMGDWGIPVAKAGDALDTLFAASQQTGVGLTQLQENIVRYGAPLRQMGFGFEQATALISKFEKEGVNTELVLGSMRIGLTQFAKKGLTPVEALKRVTAGIKQAGSTAKANMLAIQFFGARAGPDMAAAIREGRFEIDGLVKSLQNSRGAIESANKDTWGLAEMWGQAKNIIMVALEPLGKQLLALAEQWMPKIMAAIEKVSAWFERLSPGMQKAIVIIGLIVAAIGPLLYVIGAFMGAIAAISAPVLIAIGVIAGLAVVATLIATNWSRISEWLKNIWNSIAKFAKKIWDGIVKFFTNLGKAWLTTVLGPWILLGKGLAAIWRRIRGDGENVWQGMSSALPAMSKRSTDQTVSIWTKLADWFSNLWQKIAEAATGLWEEIKKRWAEQWEKMQKWLDETVPEGFWRTSWLTVTLYLLFKLAKDIWESFEAWAKDNIPEGFWRTSWVTVSLALVFNLIKDVWQAFREWLDRTNPIPESLAIAGPVAAVVALAWKFKLVEQFQEALDKWLASLGISKEIFVASLLGGIVLTLVFTLAKPFWQAFQEWWAKQEALPERIAIAGPIGLAVALAWRFDLLRKFAEAFEEWRATLDIPREMLLASVPGAIIITLAFRLAKNVLEAFREWWAEHAPSADDLQRWIESLGPLSVFVFLDLGVRTLRTWAQAFADWWEAHKPRAEDFQRWIESLSAISIFALLALGFKHINDWLKALQEWWRDHAPSQEQLQAWVEALAAIPLFALLVLGFKHINDWLTALKNWWAEHAPSKEQLQAWVNALDPIILLATIALGFKLAWDKLKGTFTSWWKKAQDEIVEALQKLVPTITLTLKLAFDFVVDTFKQIEKIFDQAGVKVKQGWDQVLQGVAQKWDQAKMTLPQKVSAMAQDIVKTFQGMGVTVPTTVAAMIAAVLMYFRKMEYETVGGSIVPDMVMGIISWFNRMGDSILAEMLSFKQQFLQNWQAVATSGVSIWDVFLNTLQSKITQWVSAALDKFRIFGAGAAQIFGAVGAQIVGLAVDSMAQAIAAWATGTGDATAILRSFLMQILSMFIKAAIQAALTSAALSEALSFAWIPWSWVRILAIAATLGAILAGIQAIFKPQAMAEGGIVTKPTFAMVGEAGPEAVIPLSRGGLQAAGIGGGITVNFYDTKIMRDSDIEYIGSRIVEVLRRKGVRG